MNKILIFVIVFFVSCSSNVTLSPKGCGGELLWALDDYNKKYDHIIETEIWTPFGLFNKTEVNVRRILEKNQVSCQDVDQITLSLSTTKKALIASLLPFTSSKTLIVKVRVKKKIKK